MVGRDGLAQFGEAGGGTVMVQARVERRLAGGLDDHLGSRQVEFACGEVGDRNTGRP